MNIRNTITDLIGDTPLLRLHKMEEYFGSCAEIVAKVEMFNPAGSISGRLKPGGTIIEPTSGNTGVGIAMAAAARGYKAVMVMPESMSIERRKLLAALGADLVLTDREEGMQGSVEKAKELLEEIPGSIIAGQFENPANPQAHYETTAPEIWKDTEGELDIFVASFGTGGTVSGIGRYLKEMNSAIRIIGVEPASSPLVTEGWAGTHQIQGIGANFIPEILDADIMDEVMTVTDEDALQTMKNLARLEGVLAGVSSGAAIFAAGQVAARKENEGKRIVTILPDTGERYLSIF